MMLYHKMMNQRGTTWWTVGLSIGKAIIPFEAFLVSLQGQSVDLSASTSLSYSIDKCSPWTNAKRKVGWPSHDEAKKNVALKQTVSKPNTRAS